MNRETSTQFFILAERLATPAITTLSESHHEIHNEQETEQQTLEGAYARMFTLFVNIWKQCSIIVTVHPLHSDPQKQTTLKKFHNAFQLCDCLDKVKWKHQY